MRASCCCGRRQAAAASRSRRDQRAEASARATLDGYGLQRSRCTRAGALRRRTGAGQHRRLAQVRARRLARPARRRLLELAPTFRYDVREIDDWYADVDQGGEGQAWFELELGIVVEGQRVPLLPILLQLIRSAPREFDAQALAAHADSEVLMARRPAARVGLPWSRIRPILNTLGELYSWSASATQSACPAWTRPAWPSWRPAPSCAGWAASTCAPLASAWPDSTACGRWRCPAVCRRSCAATS
jgi:hypothetical protein